jgi:hypothetical protein
MRRFGHAGILLPVILITIVALSVPVSHAGVIETSIDLNYTYTQNHLGDNISGDTSVQQSYDISYESAVTPIFDMLARITLDVEDTSGDEQADASSLAPSLSLTFTGPRALIRFNYDASKDRTEAYEDTDESESFNSTYVFEFEVEPEYWPEIEMKVERTRAFEEQTSEKVDKTFTLDLKKEIGNLSLEFDYEYTSTEEQLPTDVNDTEITWSGKMSYKKAVWWDVDVDLAYELEENFSEEFDGEVFTGETRDYTHTIKASLSKSLILTPRLTADVSYTYDFQQDLLLLEMDYALTQEFTLDLAYEIFDWLETQAAFERTTEKTVNAPPDEEENAFDDLLSLSFSSQPFEWVQIVGQAQWSWAKSISTSTGGSVDDKSDAVYELSAKQKWGKWWELKVTGSSEYQYADDWLVKREATLEADLSLDLYEGISVDAGYEIERVEEYEEREPLVLSESKREEFTIGFQVIKGFGELIMISFTHDISLRWEEEVDEVLNFSELAELAEDTQIKLTLQDFIRDMTLEGEITRKATDTEDDEEPVLIDLTYGLKLDWAINDLDLGASFEYDDNGDTFDESSFNTKVAWERDNINVSGEYQFDKVYKDEVDEERQLNLNLHIGF